MKQSKYPSIFQHSPLKHAIYFVVVCVLQILYTEQRRLKLLSEKSKEASIDAGHVWAPLHSCYNKEKKE